MVEKKIGKWFSKRGQKDFHRRELAWWNCRACFFATIVSNSVLLRGSLVVDLHKSTGYLYLYLQLLWQLYLYFSARQPFHHFASVCQAIFRLTNVICHDRENIQPSGVLSDLVGGDNVGTHSTLLGLHTRIYYPYYLLLYTQFGHWAKKQVTSGVARNSSSWTSMPGNGTISISGMYV